MSNGQSGGDEGGTEGKCAGTDRSEVLLWLKDVDIRPWSQAPRGVSLDRYKAYRASDLVSRCDPVNFGAEMTAFFGVSHCAPDDDDGVFIMLHCVDTTGASCAVQLTDARFSLAVRIPTDFGDRHLPALQQKIAEGWSRDGATSGFLRAWIEERTPAVYYNHNPASPMEAKKYKYAMFMFNSPNAVWRAKRRVNHVRPSEVGSTQDANFCGTNDRFVVDEARVPDVTNLLHAINIPPSTWFSVDAQALRRPRLRYTNCRYEKELSVKAGLEPRPDVLAAPPFPILSFDIEQYSHRYKRGYSPEEVVVKNAKARADAAAATAVLQKKGGVHATKTVEPHEFTPKRMFPNVDMVEDVVFAISSSTWWYNTERRERVVFLLPHPSCPRTTTLKAELTAAMEEMERAGDATAETAADAAAADDGEAKQIARPAIEVRIFDDEASLFIAWRNHLVFEVDPDVVTGYNVDKFDYSRLCRRMRMLERRRGGLRRCNNAVAKDDDDADDDSITGLSQFWNVGRYIWDAACLKKFEIQSKAMGQLVYHRLVMRGRIQLDLFYYFKRNFKLRTYRLDAVAKRYLKHHKVDLDADTMCNHWSQFHTHGIPALSKVLVYNVVDSDLCVDLISFQAILSNLFEMSAVCITLVEDLLDRGQQFKVYNQIVWHSRRWGYILNEADLEAVDPDKVVKGATVVEPIIKKYDIPVAVLDFGSLYPSIMKMMNLCYSTFVPPRRADPPPPATVHNITNPEGENNRFVSHVEGILPRLLNYLLTARKKAKGDLKKATDPMEAQVHDGRQLALKISANSVYGFTRAQKLPCPAITESVTATGRTMLFRLIAEIEKKFNCKVIYGDTDSVFIVFFDLPRDPDAAVARAFELGQQAAEYGTKMFDGKIVLEMEKVYLPMMILAKKRYCGMKYSSPTKAPELNFSGIEPARRDVFLYMSECYEELIDFVYVKRDIEGAVRCLQTYLQRIVDDAVPLEKYIRSRELKLDLKSMEHEQCYVAEKVEARDPNGAYVTGDRVEYVYITGDFDKIYLKAEDPEYVREHPQECTIDRIHYIRRAFQNPICNFLELIVAHPEKYFDEAVACIERAKYKRSVASYFEGGASTAEQQDRASSCTSNAPVRVLYENIITVDSTAALRPKKRFFFTPSGTMATEEISRFGTDGPSKGSAAAAASRKKKRASSAVAAHNGQPAAKKTKMGTTGSVSCGGGGGGRSILSFMEK